MLLLPACRQERPVLDEVQTMAYGMKPAVVRVRAYGTARFSVPPAAMSAVHDEIVRRGLAEPSGPPPEPIVVETGGGGSGSGFIIHAGGLVLTSGHVVAPVRDPASLQNEMARNGAIGALMQRYPIDTLRTLHRSEALVPLVERLISAGSLRQARTFREVDLSNGERLPFTILEYSPALDDRGDDVALLAIDRNGLPTLPLGDSSAVHLQDPIWVVGYPSVASTSDEMIGGWLSQNTDLEPTFNSGTITAIKRNVADRAVFQTDVPIYRGNSGGPAVNRRGEAIGLATWGSPTADRIKFLVPIEVAFPYLRKRGVVLRGPSPFDTAWKGALASAAESDWRAARRALLQADRLFPGNPDVLRLKRDAEAALRDLPFWKGRELALGGGLATLLALAAIPLIRRRSRRPGPLPATGGRSHVPIPEPQGEPTTITPLGGAPPDGELLGKLTILNGARAGERLGLGGSGIRIGREASFCEIVLEDPKVSRLHAEIVRLDGRVLLVDRNSSNGTWVNDQKIERRFLTDGDIIHFGGRNAVAVAFHD